ncbi:hypothetical protein BDU57DRAFT_508096 [Ampelomyces quisqualis]|uniref:Uncharacterized protein n=1 Tax=Ampelomyces quisqualis TaxID=50730 RepID=A0A6A5QW52_AMPQU|nr:hypothetical protein BDU57DRAFT_508096 [Ampelomyces quisqualis]
MGKTSQPSPAQLPHVQATIRVIDSLHRRPLRHPKPISFALLPQPHLPPTFYGEQDTSYCTL